MGSKSESLYEFGKLVESRPKSKYPPLILIEFLAFVVSSTANTGLECCRSDANLLAKSSRCIPFMEYLILLPELVRNCASTCMGISSLFENLRVDVVYMSVNRSSADAHSPIFISESVAVNLSSKVLTVSLDRALVESLVESRSSLQLLNKISSMNASMRRTLTDLPISYCPVKN